MKRTGKKFELPLSKKFYNELSGRVRTAISTVVVDSNDFYFSSVMKAIDSYITEGVMPDASSATEVLLIFHLLHSEIDKALQRSARARAAAARRRSAKACDKTQQPEETSVEAVDLKNGNGEQDDVLQFVHDGGSGRSQNVAGQSNRGSYRRCHGKKKRKSTSNRR